MTVRMLIMGTGALLLLLCGGWPAQAQVVSEVAPASQHAVASAGSGCSRPTPRTTAAFARLWATVPDRQWGGGDLGLSVRISDGRSVWLSGDTVRPGAVDGGYFVHSAALVQDAGCLVAANGGTQLFPNDADGTYYWVHDARATGKDQISVRARGVRSTGGPGPWAFRDAGFWRQRTFTVTAMGNLTSTYTGPRVTGPAPASAGFFTADGRATTRPDPSHFFYSRQSHPEFRLADGNVLVTLAQNWGGSGFHHDPTWKACNGFVWLDTPTSDVGARPGARVRSTFRVGWPG